MELQDADLITAVDLGSTSFRAIVADVDAQGNTQILALSTCPSTGMRRGKLIDLPAAAAALRELVTDVWNQIDVEDQPVALAVGGDHVRSLDSRSSLPLEGHGARVRDEHVETLHERVRTIDVPFDRVILHCLPVEYGLDDRAGIENPVGMVGTRLALDAHLITGTQSELGSLREAVALAGLELGPLIFSGCASPLAVTDENERAGGCLVIDIGAETTHYALYHRGRLRRSGAIGVGGAHVTRDLAWGLEVDETVAERHKRRWATALRTAPVTLVAEGQDGAPRPEERANMAVIAEARQQEILELVATELQWGITRPVLPSGIVLTGGGSRLHGTAALAEQVFGVRCVCRRPPADDGGSEPESWATTLGVVRAAAQERPALVASAASGAGLWNNVQRWIGRLV